MQAVKTIKEAKAVTDEKIITEESVIRLSIFAKAKKTLNSILFGDIDSINTDSEKIRNYNNYQKVENAKQASSLKLQTFFH